MCVVSMITEHYIDKWGKYPPYIQPYSPMQPTLPFEPLPTPEPVPQITPEEIAEFRRLLERAREYDKRNNEPECELAEKRQKLLDLAKQLGVEIDFV